MNEKEFNELIRRCLSDEATSEEKELVDQWLERRADRNPYSALSLDERESVRTKMLAGIAAKISPDYAKPERDLRPARRRVATYWAAAASVALLAVCAFMIWRPVPVDSENPISMVRAISTEGEVRKVMLSDSSIVWLKGNSSIVYPEKFHGAERNVTLTGEALFEVSKDPGHPFVIECGSLTARVLGTSFNIRTNKDDIEVLVLTGKVGLSSRGNNPGLIVHPNQKAVYKESQNQMAVIEAREREKMEKIAKTEYNMRFHATRMEEIIQKIELKFNVQVSVSDPRLNNCTITADFTDQSLVKTLSMICQTLQIEYAIDDQQVTLSGPGCDEYRSRREGGTF